MTESSATQYIVIYYTESGVGQVNASGPYRSKARAQEVCQDLAAIHDESDLADMLPPRVLPLDTVAAAVERIRNS